MSLSKMYSAGRIFLLLLCSFMAARGQMSIPITASAGPVCRDATATYSAPRNAAYTYVWTVSTHGNAGPMVTTSVTTSIPVTWVASGAAQVTVKGFEGTVLKEIGTLNVTVLPRPAPYITLDTRVGCQNLQVDTTREGQPPKVPEEPENCIKTCEYSQTVFTAHGAPGSTFSWTITGGTPLTATGTTCTINWGAAGPGSVTVTETSANGCKGSKTECIEIIPSPRAHFFALPDSTVKEIEVCLKQDIIFIDRSTPGSGSPIVTWLWDFGDGYTTTATSGAPIAHKYDHPGDYVVTLTVINQCNCKSTFEMRVRVHDEEGVKIECPSVVCEGARTTYKANVKCGSYNWSVTGGTIIGGLGTASIDVVWDHVDASGFGYVFFDNSGDCDVRCPGVTVVKVPVIQKTGTIDGPDFICTNEAVLYRMPQWPTTTFNWTTSGAPATLATTDQRNEILLVPQAPGTIRLHCRYYNTLLKCGGDAEMIIQVTEPPVLSGPAKACTGSTPATPFTASQAGNWAMTTPNGTTISGPSSATGWVPNFPVAGIYRIYMTGNFCLPEPLLVVVKAPPAAPDSLLGPAAVCTKVPTAYMAKNIMSGTFFAWSAAATTSLNAPTGNTTYATFTGSGPDIISVRRAWNDLPGCISAPLSRTITRPPGVPVVAGDVTPCANSYESYTAGSSFLDADYYEWAVVPANAGSVSSGQGTPNVSILWNNVATSTPATVTLRARRCDSIYTNSLAVVISGIPTIAILPADTTVCANEWVTFTVSPAISGAYSWDLGQTTSTLSSPTYQYATTGSTNVNYPVSVTITNANGCPGSTVTATTMITVKPAPVGSLTPAGTYVFCGASNINLPAALTANAQSGFGGPVTTVDWYYNGTLVTPSPNPQPSFGYGTVSQFGTYYAVLTSTNGCSSNTDTLRVIENCGPGCTVAPGYTLTATKTSQGCNTVVINSTWTAGGISQQWVEPSGHSTVSISPGTNSSTATYTFNAPGYYTVTSVVKFPAVGGGYCTKTQSVLVFIPYIPQLRTKITCSGSSYNVNLLDNSAYHPSAPITSYKLYNGSGILINSSTTATNVMLTGVAPGTYTYKLVISGGSHPACTTTATVVLPAVPSVSIAASRTTACINDAVVHFTPTVTPAGTYAYLWNFGDLSSNTQHIVSKVYSNPPNSAGPKYVTLTVTNLYGCVASDGVTITVASDKLNGKVVGTPAYPCEGQIATINYQNLGSSVPVSYEWHQPPVTLTATGSSLNVTDPGSFFVKVEDAYGCTANTNVATVNFLRIPDPAITGDTNQCDQKAFTLNGNVGPGSYTYEWKRNGAVVQIGPNFELEQSGLTPGVYTYILTVTAPNPPVGFCSKVSQPFTVTVHNLPAPPWINPPIPVSCTPYTLKLTAGASVPGTFNWSNGASGSGIITYTGGDYRVYFTDQNGCTSHANSAVPRDPNAYLWIFPTGCYQLCERNGPFTLVGPQAWFAGWEWLYNGTPDFSGTNSFVQPYTVSQNGTYNLMLDNSYCHVVSGDMNVEIGGEGCEKDPQPVPCDMRVDIVDAYNKIVKEHCEWYVQLFINNPYSMAVPYYITSSVGYAIPASGTVLAGGSLNSTYRIVFPAGFSGGSVTLTVTFELGKGQYCTKQVKFDARPCGDGIPWGKLAPAVGSTPLEKANMTLIDALSLSPNPANEVVSIGYSASVSGNLEVYDVLGRKVAAQPIAQGSGSWKLDVASYVPGIYRVVLRQGGQITHYQSLSVKH